MYPNCFKLFATSINEKKKKAPLILIVELASLIEIFKLPHTAKITKVGLGEKGLIERNKLR